MTLTIDLPDALASRLNALLPKEDRGRFAISAIANALLAQEHDSAECVEAIEEALADMDSQRIVSFEDEMARWKLQKSVLLAKSSVKEK